jgi:hypothetical protein
MRTPHAYTHITFFERSLACEKLLICCNPAIPARHRQCSPPAKERKTEHLRQLATFHAKDLVYKKKGRITQRGVIEEISRYLGILYEFACMYPASAHLRSAHMRSPKPRSILRAPLSAPHSAPAPRQCVSGSLLEP